MKTEPCYWDTSAIVSVCVPGQSRAWLSELLHGQTRMVVWWGTPVEAASAFQRLHSEQVLCGNTLRQAEDRFLDLRRAWLQVSPGEELRELAETMPERYALRAMDSFQLAAALVWCDRDSRGRGFVTLDRRLAEAAEAAGFTVRPRL